ncbi:unnamed protein product [Schistocephalus solidus]|uniref:Uncharacterized protein n=1 Tax=Schistocephalus solidus TaxID=70667 RepID=A0A183SJY2_SCHSO|nr:unnamed protein product [Schistocephalus solidus]
MASPSNSLPCLLIREPSSCRLAHIVGHSGKDSPTLTPGINFITPTIIQTTSIYSSPVTPTTATTTAFTLTTTTITTITPSSRLNNEESCSHLPLYATVLIAPGLQALAVRCVPLVLPVSSPPPIACSAASACVGRGLPLRLGSSSHLLTARDAAAAGVSWWRGLPLSTLAAGIVGGPGCFMP